MKYTVGLGDMLASFTPKGYERLVQAHEFNVTYTGAEANVLGSLANFGLKTRFVCRIPENDIGNSAIRFLRSMNIDTNYIVRGGNRLGVLYMERGASQRPSKVIYDRMNSGICEAKPEDFDFETIFKDACWFHFTGITPALSDSLVEVIKQACIAARKAGCTISCDLNYRKNLWTTEKAKQVMEPLLDYVDIVVAPVLIGGRDTPTLIDGRSLTSRDELPGLGVLKLAECTVLKDSYIRLRYEVVS